MSFNIRNGAKLKYTIPAGGVGDNFLVVDPTTGEVSFRTPSEVGALAIGGSSGDVLYNNSGVIGGFGDWDTTRLEIGGNLKLGESSQAGSARAITADGSASDVAITLTPKGAGALNAGTSTINLGNTGDVLVDNVSATANSSITIRSKGTSSAILKSPSGNVVLSAGASSEVVLGESTTAASTRIISADGSGANVDIILEPKGSGTLISEANFTIGSTSLAGSSRTIKSGGSASNVDLILATKGDGNVSLISESPSYGSGVNVVFIPNTATPTSVAPVGGGTLYSSSQNLIWFGTKSYNLTNQFVGKNINSVVATPTITEDGQGLVWDNTAGEYTLGTLTASAGGTNTQIQYNNSGNLGGFGSWDGSTMTVPGSFQIGDSGTAGTNRNITAEGSVGNVSITLDPKGTANIILAVDGGQVSVGSGSGSSRTIQAIGSATDVSLILAPQGAGSVYSGSNFYIGTTTLAGTDRILAPEGSSSNINLQIVPKGTGNLSLFSTTPTYGSGEGIVYIKSAGVAPTGSITGGGALYVTSSAIRFVNSSGTDYDLTQTAFVAVRKNSTGGDVGVRRRINFIEGTGVTMTIADDAGDDEIDVTINASGGGVGYTNEEAQDAVGTILTDTSSINFTYDDATPQITADVIADSSVQRVAIRKNSTGGDTGTRRRLNFIEGTNTTITLADDGLDNELDITIGTSGDYWNLATGGTLTGANTITGTTSNTLKLKFNSLGTTVTNGAGIWLANETSAAAGSQQISPSLVWEGQGWKTTTTAESQSVKFKADVLPVQSAANPLGTWRLSFSVNGAAYTDAITVSTSGAVVTISSLVASGIAGVNTFATSTSALSSATSNNITIQTPFTTGVSNGRSVLLNPSIGLSSGSLVYHSILATPTYNFTGTHSSGTISFIDYNPTLTSLTGVTSHLAWRNTSGKLLFGGTTITAGSVLADFQSSTEGVLVPRPTVIADIATPVNGMVAYDATTNLWNFRQAGAWVNLGSGGTGDVVGPASATDNAIVRFDLTTGKLIQDSTVTLSDTGTFNSTGAYNFLGSSTIGINPTGTLTIGGVAGTNIGTIVYTSSAAQNINITGGSISGTGSGQGHVKIKGGNSAVNAINAADVYINSGDSSGTGLDGNVAFLVDSVSNWQSAEKVLFIANRVADPSAAIANGIAVYSKDSSDGSTNSTLALYTEQAPEATGTFTQTHRLKIWINNVEYYISLDQV